MNYIDLLLGFPILWGAFVGFKKGLVIELASIVALLLGIYGAIHLSDHTTSYLAAEFDLNTQWLGFLGFAITFLAIVIGVFFLGKLLDKMLKMIALGLVNRILGLLFGLLKYILIMSVLLFLIENLNGQFNWYDKSILEESLIYQFIHLITDPLKPLFERISLNNMNLNFPELP